MLKVRDSKERAIEKLECQQLNERSKKSGILREKITREKARERSMDGQIKTTPRSTSL